MPAPLSVIIPTLNAAPEAAGLLAELMDGVATGLVREVIVSDGGSSDDIEELAEAVGAEFVSGAAGRGGQLRRGVAAARGEWFLALHADSRLPNGWAETVQAAMAAQGRAYAFRLGFRAQGLAPWLVAGWANLRTRVLHLPYGDQGLLVARPDYADAGGYRDIPLMEDVALVRALNCKVVLLPLVLTTSAGRYEAEGWLRRGARNLSLLLRYLAGADPEQLARAYSGKS
ncbi:TIGR04283 family arsenosugar biosynthesis glycosyltransferase [Tropicimonas sp. TH_r6]|uniref:TIGR04283 family arsenosugar biosynthesis glycosyltransferase n=1 Tax=Tropicimonas sp. TH_r6 TaxID=3082085 RepID=UPI002954026A|nr:TIGR04283 family arsenosugar biosynthesis glycosyltransferase [Tropicimonas sp. TH_r6]MDV7144509.1 TIGR04283 family arsenosugar biosynthesis glycosyltransferase [Tropicimonas sp. TH_r6]